MEWPQNSRIMAKTIQIECFFWSLESVTNPVLIVLYLFTWPLLTHSGNSLWLWLRPLTSDRCFLLQFNGFLFHRHKHIHAVIIHQQLKGNSFFLCDRKLYPSIYPGKIISAAFLHLWTWRFWKHICKLLKTVQRSECICILWVRLFRDLRFKNSPMTLKMCFCYRNSQKSQNCLSVARMKIIFMLYCFMPTN